MDELRKIISISFYTQLLMILSAILALTIAIVHRKKFRELDYIIFYPVASLIQGAIAYYCFVNGLSRDRWSLDTVSTSLFVLIEFLIIYKFFYKIIILEFLKRYIKIILFIYLLYLILIWAFTNSFYKHPIKVFLLESLCILFFCFIYLYQIFRLPPKQYLLNNPPFWITIGCLFYFSCTIPLFFLDSILYAFPQYYKFYSINYLAYTILFIFISKAFLCKPVPAK